MVRSVDAAQIHDGRARPETAQRHSTVLDRPHIVWAIQHRAEIDGDNGARLARDRADALEDARRHRAIAIVRDEKGIGARGQAARAGK